MGLIVELVPPILLCFTKTQKYGAVMLMLLHWMLLPVGFADFGSIAQSFLWLFVSPTVIADNNNKGLPSTYYTDMAGCFVFMEIIAFSLFKLRGDEDDEHIFKGEEAAMVFLAYGIHWMNIFRMNGLKDGITISKPKSVFSMLPIGFFIFFTFNQYLGLRTTGTLTMFSNLRTEGHYGTSNHILLRSNPIKFFGYQEDVVKILEIDEDIDQEDWDYRKGYSYQRLVFSRDVKRGRPYKDDDESIYLKVLYKGKIYETSDLHNDPTFDVFRQEESWLSRKYFDFRDIQPTDHQECVW
jgi:hypothetical protein